MRAPLQPAVRLSGVPQTQSSASRAQCAHSGRMQLTRGACCGGGVAAVAVAVAVGAAVASARVQLAVIGVSWARRRAADAARPPACRNMMEVAVSAANEVRVARSVRTQLQSGMRCDCEVSAMRRDDGWWAVRQTSGGRPRLWSSTAASGAALSWRRRPNTTAIVRVRLSIAT